MVDRTSRFLENSCSMEVDAVTFEIMCKTETKRSPKTSFAARILPLYFASFGLTASGFFASVIICST